MYKRQEYKDDATAFNALKKGTIAGKGVVNNKMTCIIFKMLEDNGIPTHLVNMIDDNHQLVKAVEIVPLEVIAVSYTHLMMFSIIER